MATLKETMAALEAAGSAQARKTYTRHGVGANQFGVSYAVLGALVKKIKTDHALAEALWATGNHDALVLATMIADPAAATRRLLDAWARTLDNYVIADAFARYAGRTPVARDRAEAWAASAGEWIGRAGWLTLANLAREELELPDSYFLEQLATIEKEIHGRKNRVRDAMNSAVIAIGVRNEALRKAAVAAATRIGKVEVDHGETGCKTPDAAAYIEKTLAHRKKAPAKKAPARQGAAAKARAGAAGGESKR